MRDKLWFFGFYLPGIRYTERTVTFTNGVTNTFDQDFKVHYGAVNVPATSGRKSCSAPAATCRRSRPSVRSRPRPVRRR